MYLTGLTPSYFKDTTSTAAAGAANSYESGYESLLCYNSSFLDSSASNSLHSQPTTPSKTQQHEQQQQQQQYVADINAFYFASLKSPAKSNAPFSSVAQSPAKLLTSPAGKLLNPDDFIRERDTFKSKLLRSPAFKSPYNNNNSFGGERANEEVVPVVVKSFTSRLSALNKNIAQHEFTPPLPPPPPAKQQTPTEEEFMQLLLKNCHLPRHPDFLIGSRMGLEHVDMLGELNKRSMHMVIDQIFVHLNQVDLVKVACVSREWRAIVRQDTRRNKERARYLKQKREIYEMNKENPFGCTIALDRRLMMSAGEKRMLFRESKQQQHTLVIDDHNDDNGESCLLYTSRRG